jgi:hypothetical protein
LEQILLNNTHKELEKLRMYVSNNIQEIDANFMNSSSRPLVQRFAAGEYSGRPHKQIRTVNRKIYKTYLIWYGILIVVLVGIVCAYFILSE